MSGLKVVNEENKPEVLKELKRQKRLARKERKKRKLETLKQEQSILTVNHQLTQSEGEYSDTSMLLAKGCLYIGAFLLFVSDIVINTIAGQMQAGTIPAWMETANHLQPTIRNAGALFGMNGLLVIGGSNKLKNAFCLVLYVVLCIWCYHNQMYWTHSTINNAVVDKKNERKAELEKQYHLEELWNAYKNAERNETTAIDNQKRECDRNNGTVCRKLIDVSKTSTSAKDASLVRYNNQKEAIERQVEKEISPSVSSDSSQWLNAIVPFFGGIFLKLISWKEHSTRQRKERKHDTAYLKLLLRTAIAALIGVVLVAIIF